MDPPSEIVKQLSFLTRAESRIRILEHLSAVEPTTQRELRDAISASRTTIIRAVDSLAEKGWVTEQSDGVRLTPVGRLVIEEFLDLVDAVAAAEDLAPFLRWFPLSEFDIDIQDLQEATVTTTGDGDPLAPARIQTDLLRSTKEFRGLFPSMDFEGTKLVHEQTMETEFDSVIIVSATVEKMVRNDRFRPLYEEMLATGKHSLYVTDTIPFYLGLGDDGVTQIGVEDDEGYPRALLETANERVRSWAEELFEDHRQAADQITDL